MKKFILPLAIVATLFLGCRKERGFSCDHAVACVTNVSGEVVYYSWNSSLYTDSILPGQKACVDVGYISNTPTEESTVTTTFNSSRGNIGILVNECNEFRDIN